MMEWSKVMKDNEMIQLFSVDRSWNQWFLSKKKFCTRRYRKKMFRDLTTNSLIGR